MDFKKNIIRILLLALWIVLGTSVLVLLVAAINIKNHKLCKGIDIEIQGVKNIFFLDKADILKIVADEGTSNPAGKAITGFNLQRLEAMLEKNVWVKDAELFFDNNLVLHVNILEKEPVARVFSNNGYSFYIDSSGNRMPLNDKMNVKLPVFTGFPAEKRQSITDDSLLIDHIRKITVYILHDPFWMAQIAQVEITADKNFEMIPTVGNHIIQFGDGYNYENKFRRLLIFYKDVLSQAGLDKYSRISVQYDRQVIGTKKGMITKIDSVQALKNIQKLIEEANKISEDSVYQPSEVNTATVIPVDTTLMELKIDSANETRKKAFRGNSNSFKPVVVPAKPVIKGKPIKKQVSKPAGEKPKPKAIMNKLVNEQQ
ncbi:MAG: hypothetical protein ABIN89_22040 [Chitinophagaceae bacterium]